MDLKELFEKGQDGKLSFDEFEKLAKEAKAKFVDLSEGGYVSKGKYDDDIKGKDDEINVLNGTITERETDLADLQKKLKEAGTDSTKLEEINSKFNELQSKYDEDVKSYKDMLDKQKYEFAVKDFASTKKFTSNAAKRDFINSMISKNLQLGDKGILGAEDFVKEYTEVNGDAFIVEQPAGGEPNKNTGAPQFVKPTGSSAEGKGDGKETFNFNFTPLHKPVEK